MLDAHLSAARSECVKALAECGDDPHTAEVARRLHGLNYLLMGIAFSAGDAINAAQDYEMRKQLEQSTSAASLDAK